MKERLWGFKIEQTSSEKNQAIMNEILQAINEAEEMTKKQQEQRQSKFIKKEWNEDDERQEMINYAFTLGWYDLVALIECENANRDPFRKAYWNEDSRGLCMINRRRHKDIVDSPTFWNDWRFQIDKCSQLMKWWTAFYGRNRQINGMKCSEYVKNRFSLVN